MPADQSQPQSRGWRKDVTPGARKSEAQKAWRKEAAAPAADGKRPMSRKAKLAGVAVLFMAVVGGLVWWIMRISPAKPVYYVLIGAGYEQNLAIPHNVYGLTGISGVEKLFGDNDALVKVSSDHKPASWQHAIQDFKNKGEKAIVVYLAMHGGADHKGPYLLFDNPAPGDDEKSLLRMEQVLKELKSLPSEKKKLLILDATQIRHCRRLMIVNDFSRKLNEMGSAIKAVDNLVVLSSTDEDQRSWTSDEWRQSAFGHYVQEGLKGAADNGKGRVTAQTLFAYVREKVKRWAHDNRDASQTPVLLPKGEEGENRASAMELALAEETYRPSPVPPVRTMPSDLEKHWKEKEELARLVPAPAVYSPHIWAQYLETLLRYEQLLRAGATSDANLLADKKLAFYRDEILKAKPLAGQSSAQNALPVPLAYGLLERGLLDGSEAQFKKLWDAPTKARQISLWKGLLADDKEKVLPVRLCAWLLNKSIDDGKNLEKASQMVRDLLGAKDIPAEAHHMVMWQQDLGQLFGEKTPASLPLALRTRRLAEEAALGVPEGKLGEAGRKLVHPYSEFVQPWIKAKIDAADKERREGQDKLFSATADDIADTDKQLTAAAKLYREAIVTAGTVRAALEMRAQVMSELPFYGDWLALRRPDEDKEFADYSRVLGSVESLWESAHKLSDLLEKGPSAGKIDGQVSALRELANTLRESLDGIKVQFSKSYEAADDKELQKNWHALEAMLSVPFVEAPRRSELLRYSAKISRGLNDKTSKGDVPAHDAAKVAKINAERLAQMTLARLGDSAELFPKPSAHKTSDEMKNMIPKLRSAGWQDVAVTFGEETGLRFQEMATKIAKHAEESQKAKEIAGAIREMLVADRLSRQIDGAGASELGVLKPDLNPVAENRRLHMHDLAVWLADRTLQDRWFGDKNQPYFRDIGVKYGRDAVALAGVGVKDEEIKSAREKIARKKNAELTQPVSLKFSWSATNIDTDFKETEVDFHVTSEKEYDLYFRINAKGVASGYPVVYVEPGKAELADPKRLEELKRPQSRALQAEHPTSVTLPRGKNPFYKNLFDPKVKPSANPTEFFPQSGKVHGLFRSYRFELDAAVNLHPRANTIVYQYPVPSQGAVLVFADEDMHRRYSPRQGSVAILVDLSGSMAWGHAHNKPPRQGEQSRFAQARGALADMMGNFTPGVDAQLWIFSGKRRDGKKDRRNKDAAYNQRYNYDFPSVGDLIASSSKWTGVADKEQFLRKFDEWEPDEGTPLVRSMEEVVKTLSTSSRPAKTLIVLTDGGDNNPDEEIKRVKGIFANKGIALHLIGFHITDEERKAFVQLKKALESMTPPGEVYDVDDKKKLAGILINALRWNYQLGKPREAKPKKQLIQEISRPNELDNWLEVEPLTYELRENKIFSDEKRPLINIQAGQLRMYRLTEDGLTRAVFAPTRADNPWPKSENGWQLAVLNHFKQRQSQEFLVLLENLLVKQLEDPVPGQVWLELQPPRGDPKENTAVAGLRWGAQLGYPAPAWKVESATTLDKSTFKAWVRHKALDGELVQRGQNKPLASFGNRTRTLEGKTDVIIESVKIEEFKVVNPLGDRDPSKKMPCVVVRMSYPKGKPAFVQPYPLVDPKSGGGYEHHFYADAGTRGKYTGIFWYGQDLESNVEAKVSSIMLFAVEAFKTEQGTDLLKIDLGKPDAPGSVDAIEPYLQRLGLR
jgi:hypothetical protein